MDAAMTILVVEDHAVNRRLLQAILTKAGHEIVMAEDGAAGVARFQDGGVDLVLMDLMMPVMDGFESCATIRDLPGGWDVPVIAVTADMSPGIKERVRAAGFNGFVAKPFTAQQIMMAIRTHISSSVT